MSDKQFCLCSPSPAGQLNRCPLKFLILSNLKFRARVPNACCILQFRPNKSFVCTFLSVVNRLKYPSAKHKRILASEGEGGCPYPTDAEKVLTTFLFF